MSFKFQKLSAGIAALLFCCMVSAFAAAPSAPTLATPTDAAINQAVALTLTWSSPTGAETFGVAVSTAATFASTVTLQDGLTAPQKALSGLTNAKAYYWRANAGNGDGTSAWAGAWSFTTVVATPALSAPRPNITNQLLALTLTWATAVGATSYGIQASSVNTFASTVYSGAGLTAHSQALAGLTKGSSYYWRVNAADANGTSAWVTAWRFYTIPKAGIYHRDSLAWVNWLKDPLPGVKLKDSVRSAAAWDTLAGTDDTVILKSLWKPDDGYQYALFWSPLTGPGIDSVSAALEVACNDKNGSELYVVAADTINAAKCCLGGVVLLPIGGAALGYSYTVRLRALAASGSKATLMNYMGIGRRQRAP